MQNWQLAVGRNGGKGPREGRRQSGGLGFHKAPHSISDNKSKNQ